MRHRGHMKPKREKWAKHQVHCACGDALREVLAALRTQRRVNQIVAAVTDALLDGKNKLAVIATLSSRLALESISSDYGLAVDALLAKYATVLHEKGGAPNTQTSLNPVNKGRRGSRKPKHTTSGTTNLAGPQISMAPEPRRAVSDPKGRVRWSHTRTTAASIKGDGNVRGCCVTGQPEPAPIVEGLGSVRSETRECLPSAAMPTGAIPISHAWLDNRCARCGHEHEGPCPFCECAEHVEPVDPYEVEVERALEDAARNPSL